MANIDPYLEAILAAVYGEEVRGSIHDAIAAMNLESTEAMSTARIARDSAKNYATAAGTSASNAANSASAAASSASNAATSASNAATSATNAASSASAAAASADNASSSDYNASVSAAAAATSDYNAAASATNAAASATNAANSASSASTAASSAESSASDAESSASNAASSATNAATSETNAKTSEINAARSAEHTAQIVDATNFIVGVDPRSIKHPEMPYLSSTDVVDNLTSEIANRPLSAAQGKLLKTLIDSISPSPGSEYLTPSDVVDNLTSTATNKPLSANQGKALKALIDLCVAKTDIVNNLTSDAVDAPLSAKQGKELKGMIGEKYVIFQNVTAGLYTDNSFSSRTFNIPAGGKARFYALFTTSDMDNLVPVFLQLSKVHQLGSASAKPIIMGEYYIYYSSSNRKYAAWVDLYNYTSEDMTESYMEIDFNLIAK